MRVLRLGEAAQVADHHQDVLVDRVDVEEVVLHLADDAPERREVVAEDAVQVHPPQLVREAARLAEDLHEARAVARVARGTRRRSACGRATARAACAPSCPLSSWCCCISEERVEHRARAAARTGRRRGRRAARRRAGNRSSIGDRSAARGKDRACRFCSRIVLTWPHHLGGAVVALHQLLAARCAARVSTQTELRRERGLQIEHQPVLAPAGEIVQPDAQLADEALLCANRARLAPRDEAGARELAPSAAEARGARDPEHRLQVAQAARAFLDVGLEVVGRVVVLAGAAAAARAPWRRRRPRRPSPAREALLEAARTELARAREQAVLEQARADRDVAAAISRRTRRSCARCGRPRGRCPTAR